MEYSILADWFMRANAIHKNDNERKTHYSENVNELETKLNSMLDENQKKLFKNFKYYYHEHMFDVYFENLSDAIASGILIGLDLYPVFNPS